MIVATVAALLLAPAEPTRPAPPPVSRSAPERIRRAEWQDAADAYFAALRAEDETRIRTSAERLVEAVTAAIDSVSDAGERNRMKLMRGAAFWSLDRIEEADGDLLIQPADTLFGTGYWQFRFDRAVEENDGPTAARLLIIDAAATENPRDAQLHRISLDGIFFVDNSLDENDDMARAFHQALIDVEYDFAAPPGARDYLYRWVFEDRLDEGDMAEAREALANIRSPYSITGYITTRKYEAFWPFLEEQHGRDLGRLVERYGAELEAAKNLEDPRYRMVYAEFLRDTGQYQRMVGELGPFVSDWERNLSEGEYAHWAVNAFAHAEMKIGRTDSAVARMAELSSQETGSYLIGMQINRLLMLLDARRFEEALTGAEQLGAASASANEFGRMFIRQAAACAAHELGMTEKAQSWGEQIDAAPEENRLATLRYRLCTGQHTAAEQHMMAWLESDSASGMVQLLQDYRRRIENQSWDDEMISLQKDIAGRPAVQEALLPVGRILSLDLAE